MNPVALSRLFIKTLFVMLLLQISSLNAQENGLEGMPSGTYNVDPTHASVVWKVSHLGFSTYVGRFNSFTADLDLDTEDFTKSAVNVDIKVDSIDTAFPFPDEEDFNKKLSEGWFKSADHPSITFVSKNVTALTDNKATVTGDLTMLGKTQEVALDITFNKAAASHPFTKLPVIGFSGTTTIDRTSWGLSKFAPSIGAKVDIEIEGEFVKNK